MKKALILLFLKRYWNRLLKNVLEQTNLHEVYPLRPFPESRDGRLTLRGLRRQEIDEFIKWLRDPQLARYTFGLKLRTGEAYVQSVVEDYVANIERVLNNYTAICIDEKLIGSIFYNTRDVAGQRLAIVGIVIGVAEERRRGYGVRSMKMMLKYLFEELCCSCVELDTADYNTAAQRTYEKLGFCRCSHQMIYEGLDVFPNDNMAPPIYYRISAQQWQEGGSVSPAAGTAGTGVSR